MAHDKGSHRSPETSRKQREFANSSSYKSGVPYQVPLVCAGSFQMRNEILCDETSAGG